MPNQYDDIQEWATEGGGEGDPASSASEIQTYVESDFANLGTLHDDDTTLPGTATGRPNGIFADYHDVLDYLESGGLVILDPDTGDPIPNPIVHIVKRESEYHDWIDYEVWIDEES